MKPTLYLKYIFMGMLLAQLPFLAYSQENVIHEGEVFFIDTNANIYVFGDFKDTIHSTVDAPVTNLGNLHLYGNLNNQGNHNFFGTNLDDFSNGRLWLVGANSDSLYGRDTIHLHNLYLNTGASEDFTLSSYTAINDSLFFINGNIYLKDSLTLRYVANNSSPVSGLVDESNLNRAYGPSVIRLENYPWQIASTYSYDNLKNIGLALTVSSGPLSTGAAPIIRRLNVSQAAGPSTNSVERTYYFDSISNPGNVSNISSRFHDPNELGLNIDGTEMHIYKSSDLADSWVDLLGTSGVGEVSNTPSSSNISNNTLITVAKDSCDVLPSLRVDQIITSSIPNDTVIDIDSALACDPNSLDVQLLAVGDPGIYSWQEPDGTIVPNPLTGPYTPDSLGTYIVTLQDFRGCINRDTVVVDEALPAGAEFQVSGAGYCANAAVSFSPDSLFRTGYTYEWDFDDGNTSNLYNATNTFTTDGTYMVTLTITTDQGCIDAHQENVVIHQIPNVSFSSVSACPGDDLSLINNTSASPAQGVNLTWTISYGALTDSIITTTAMGNGTGGNVDFAFPNEGTYSVTLDANSNGCAGTSYTDNVVVYPQPVPSFTFVNACEGENVVFTNTSSISDASSLGYLWDFNNGVGPTSTITNPTYAYQNDGTYTVSLTTNSINGCEADTLIDVTVNENPTVSINLSDTCVNTLAHFSGVSTDPTIANWNWDFGDGNNATGQNVFNTYTLDGSYSVTLNVATSNGCLGSANTNIIIFQGPTVAYSAIDGCTNSNILFQNITSNAVSYEWNFPSLGYTSSNFSENQSFANSGYHTAILEATSSNGCVGSFTDSVFIYPLPDVNLGGTNLSTCGTTYPLDADPFGANAGYSFFWNTGATTPQYTATYDGEFHVTVTSPQGCVNYDTTNITLNANVEPDLGADRTICDVETLDAGYTGATYSWSNTATSQTIDVITSGNYSVTVTDVNGCIGTDDVNIVVAASDPINLGASSQFACLGQTITLDAGYPGNAYSWNTGANTQTIDVVSDGYYFVEMTNASGCVSYDTVQTTFSFAPSVDLGSDTSYCVQGAYNVFTTNASYLWSTGSTNSSITISNSGTYWVDVTDNTTSCVSRDSVDVIVNDLPLVDLGNDTTLCSYQDITLDAGNPGASYVWNNGALTQTTTVFTTGLYAVDVTDINGCENSDQVNVVLLQPFTIDLGIDRPFCDGSTVVLDPGEDTTGATFNWYDASGSLSSASTFAVPDTGVYFLDMIDQYGCLATDSVTVLPSNQSLFAQYLADSEVLTGDTIQFINLSYPKPYTSLWDFDNGAMSTDSMPTYTYFLPGVYDVKLTVNNGNCVSEMEKAITVSPSKTFRLRDEVPTSLYTEINSMNLYPNPNDGQFTLDVSLENKAALEIMIVNLVGQVIHTEVIETREFKKVYSFRDLESGVYIVRARAGRDVKSLKFVKVYR